MIFNNRISNIKKISVCQSRPIYIGHKFSFRYDSVTQSSLTVTYFYLHRRNFKR